MKPLAVALAAVTLIRLAVAATTPLAPDEAYYWVWSHALATGYLDHPPMVALWIRAGTALAGQTALGVRLLGPLSAALASWMLFDAARVLFPMLAESLPAAPASNATRRPQPTTPHPDRSNPPPASTGARLPEDDPPSGVKQPLKPRTRSSGVGLASGTSHPAEPSRPLPERLEERSFGLDPASNLHRPLKQASLEHDKVSLSPSRPGADLSGAEQAGVIASTLLNGSLLLGVGTVIMTPDSPLLFFWTAALWAMARIAVGGGGAWWLAAGMFSGLALDSKYTALLLWAGIGLWTLVIPVARSWLRRWYPWAACAIGLALFIPVLAWNADHAWAGFLRQGGRIDDWKPARALGFLGELIGGQIGLATPLIWLLCMAGLLVATRRAWQRRNPAWSLLAALSLLPVLVFVQHATGDRVQGNWPAIIYPALAIAAAGLAATRRWWVPAAALGFAITALAYVQAATGLLPLPARFDPIALRLVGWDRLAQEIEALNAPAPIAFVAADDYGVASELAWWLPAQTPVLGTDPRWALTTLPARPIIGTSGLLLRDARRTDPPSPDHWTGVERIATLSRPGSNFAVFRVTATGEEKAVYLPCRPCLADSSPSGPAR